jgi:hypothetical protein
MGYDIMKNTYFIKDRREWFRHQWLYTVHCATKAWQPIDIGSIDLSFEQYERYHIEVYRILFGIPHDIVIS